MINKISNKNYILYTYHFQAYFESELPSMLQLSISFILYSPIL